MQRTQLVNTINRTQHTLVRFHTYTHTQTRTHTHTHTHAHTHTRAHANTTHTVKYPEMFTTDELTEIAVQLLGRPLHVKTNTGSMDMEENARPKRVKSTAQYIEDNLALFFNRIRKNLSIILLMHCPVWKGRFGSLVLLLLLLLC